MRYADAIVIGAGLSGLSAARQLMQQGASVLVLEASDRVGGRIHSEQIRVGQSDAASLTVDLGAQFVGDAHKRVAALVAEVGLTRLPRHEEGKSLYLDPTKSRSERVDGEGVPLSILGKLDAMQMLWRVSRRQAALSHRDAAELDRITTQQYLRSLAFTDEAYRYLHGFVEGEFCMLADRFSAYELLKQSASVGGREAEASSAGWFLAEGTGPMVQHLADTLGPRLVLNAPTIGIEQDEDGVTVATKTNTYRARDLIVATPPQLYRSMGLAGTLPPHRRQVINGYEAGSVIKNVLVFDAPWWRKQQLSGSMLCPGALCNAAMDASTRDFGVLILFSTAGSGNRLGQTKDEHVRVEKILEWLGTVTGQKVPKPLAARSINWNDDPWSLGGYSSRRGPGGWVAAPDLFDPIGRIHFAGTETATEWRAFMEGALQSAERAASAVLGHRSLLNKTQ